MINETTQRKILVITIIVLVFIAGFLLIITPQEQRNYEVRGADGTVYHTTNISHGTNRIWFTDKKGNRVELGGGYTVIQK